MDIKVEESIAELLYTHNLVIVPGLGGFMAEEAGAKVDQVLGKISPPAKKVKFNENLLVDDGVLHSYLMQEHSISKLASEMYINDFVKQAKELLDKREIIVFPNLGRLYKDFQGNFKFLQDNSNHNVDVYGLGDVPARPILRNTAIQDRNKPKEETIKVGPVATTGYAPVRRKKGENNILLGVLLSAALFALFAIVLFPGLFKSDEPAYQSTAIDELQDLPVTEDDEEDDAYELWDDDVEDIVAEEEEVERLKDIRDWEEALVVVGVFGDKKNAESLIKRILEKGYEADSRPRGSSTAVAVRFAYSSEEEFEEKFEQVKNYFNKKAWVYTEPK